MQIEQAGAAGALIAFATAPGEVARDGADGHSPFTAALLSHLGDADEPLTSVMTKVTRDVLAATGGIQRPWVNMSLSEDLQLNRSRAPQTAASGPSSPQASPAEIAELEQLRRILPAIEANEVDFDKPLKVGDPALDGKSLAQLTRSVLCSAQSRASPRPTGSILAPPVINGRANASVRRAPAISRKRSRWCASSTRSGLVSRRFSPTGPAAAASEPDRHPNMNFLRERGSDSPRFAHVAPCRPLRSYVVTANKSLRAVTCK